MSVSEGTEFCFEVFCLPFFITNFPLNYRGATSGAIKVVGDTGRQISILGDLLHLPIRHRDSVLSYIIFDSSYCLPYFNSIYY